MYDDINDHGFPALLTRCCQECLSSTQAKECTPHPQSDYSSIVTKEDAQLGESHETLNRTSIRKMDGLFEWVNTTHESLLLLAPASHINSMLQQVHQPTFFTFFKCQLGIAWHSALYVINASCNNKTTLWWITAEKTPPYISTVKTLRQELIYFLYYNILQIICIACNFELCIVRSPRFTLFSRRVSPQWRIRSIL